MTGQKIDHGEKRRELEVVDRCEYKRYSLSTPAYSLSHDGERQAPAEADVSLGKENEFWITNGDRFPGLLWSPARTRAGDQQAETPRKTGLHSSFKQLSAHKGVCLQCIQPSLCPAPGPLSFGPQESCLPFSSPPKTLSWRLKMSKCETRLHIGLCWGFVFARRLGGEDCVSWLFLNPDFWNLIWKNTKMKTGNSSHESLVALGILFRWACYSLEWPGAQGVWDWQTTEMHRGSRQFQKAPLLSIPGEENATLTWHLTSRPCCMPGSVLDGDGKSWSLVIMGAHLLDEEIDGCNIFMIGAWWGKIQGSRWRC